MVDNFETTLPAEAQVIEAATAAPMQLENGAVDFPTAFANWKANEITRAQNIIKLGFFQGQTTQQMARDIKNTIDGVTKRNAMTIARTATNHMSNQAKTAFAKENDDLITGYQWVSTLDSRTSTICRDRDGTIYSYADDYNPMPPAHFSCRSTVIFTLDGNFSFNKKGATRASKDGQSVINHNLL